MNQGLVDTLSILCKQTRKTPMVVLADRAGYHKTTVQWHIKQLVALGLVTKDRYWKPTFEPPFDRDTLTARVILAQAVQEAAEIPWLQDQLLTLTQRLGKPPDPVFDRAWLEQRLLSILNDIPGTAE